MKKFLFILIFYSTNTLACLDKPLLSDTPTTFLLATGANTGELTKANSDAQAFAYAIQNRFNIDTDNLCVIPDVGKLQFKQALTKLQELVKPQDKVFIYFSGHGTNKTDHDNDEIDCSDDEAFVTNSNILLTDDDFVSLVNAINTDDIITFIDSCFASGMLRGEENCSAKSKFWLWPNLKNTEDKLPSKYCPTSKLISKSKLLKGTIYAATKENQLAWEYPQGSIFTSVFLENMRLDENASLDEIFDTTAKEVREKTKNTACKQEPQKW